MPSIRGCHQAPASVWTSAISLASYGKLASNCLYSIHRGVHGGTNLPTLSQLAVPITAEGSLFHRGAVIVQYEHHLVRRS